MAFCKNHKYLYFDRLRRTEKAEAVLCLIHASYQTNKHHGTKKDIVRMLKNGYELFRFDAGSYTGESDDQFASQYTIGHELGIWLNSDLQLCPLAEKVARNEITIKDYFDIFFLNYIQPIDHKINHPLASALEYVKNKGTQTLTKEDLKNIYSFSSDSDKNDINGLFNMFIGSNYFSKISSNELTINYPIDDILECCNKKYVEYAEEEVTEHFSDVKDYVEYLTTDHRSFKLLKDKFYLDKNINKNSNEEIGYNKIFYGIPGCGKSFHIEKELLEKVDEENNVFRTTFYLDYSNSDFIGQIYPKVDKDGNVSYEEVPGPFTKALERALNLKNDEMVYLVIEEINRGNAAAIFGDTFQLLDRLRENRDGRVIGDSEYPISNSFIEGYFTKKGIKFTPNKIFIPHNLTILATMNTSDQNVFPLDTAFKRRWDREKVVNNWDKANDVKSLFIPYTDVTWEKFATTINKAMIKESQDADAPISEDKQMGTHFARNNMLSSHKDNQLDINEKDKAKSFTNNVLDYLYNDVTKFDHDILFNSKIATIDDIYDLVDKYEKDQNINSSKVFKNIFKSKIVEKLTGQSEEDTEQAEEDIDDEE